MMTRLQKLCLFLVAGALVFAQPVEARSLGELLRALGNSIAHPQHRAKPKPTPHSNRRGSAKKTTTADPTQPQPSPAVNAVEGVSEVAPSVPPSPAPTRSPEPIVRSASASTSAGSERRDFPYAVPVPNKPGFVTSPYAPRAGLVDVRGFASGTEVKDPYTGKIFLTP